MAKIGFVPGTGLTVSLLLGGMPTSGIAAGDPLRGAQEFFQCAACHSVQPGRHLTGPSLAHVWGSKAGTAEGFTRYTDALQHSNIVWDAKALNRWLTNPQALVPGTAMTFPGIREPAVRADVIAFLQSVSEGKAPNVSPSGGMMGGMMGRGMMGGAMMGGAQPTNLKDAGPASQVASLHHCRDTYVVKTQDGSVHKLWEYNVRLKTDSSGNGPNPGKPVIIGSGMSGDRVSIVFTSPKDLGDFIKESCD